MKAAEIVALIEQAQAKLDDAESAVARWIDEPGCDRSDLIDIRNRLEAAKNDLSVVALDLSDPR